MHEKVSEIGWKIDRIKSVKFGKLEVPKVLELTD